MKKYFKKILLIVGVIVLLFLIFRDRDDSGIGSPGNILNPNNWHKPKPIANVVVKPDTIGTLPDPGVPHVDVTHGTIGDGQIDLVFSIDSTLIQLAYDVSLHGHGQLYIDGHGNPTIFFPRFGFEPNLLVGPSIRGLNIGLETFFVNNFLGIGNIHLPTPEVVVDFDSVDSTLIGVGADIDIVPQHTNIRLGISYDWRIRDLRPEGLNAYIAVEVLRF